MLALNMPSSSPRSPELEPLAYSSFAPFLIAPNKTCLLKIMRCLFLQLDFNTVTRMLKYCNNYSFSSNAAGRFARIDSWLLFSGIQANNLTQCNLHSGRPAGMNHKKYRGYFSFQFSMLLHEICASVCCVTVMAGEAELLKKVQHQWRQLK